MSGVEIITVDDGEAGARLDRWFRRRYPDVRQGQLQRLLRTGQVRVDGARAKADQRLVAGQAVRVPPLGASGTDAVGPGLGTGPGTRTGAGRGLTSVSPHDAEFLRTLVLYDHNDVIALNKPPGLAVQGGTKTTRHIDALLPALAHKGEVPRLAHRLDRDTSGVLLLGRTPAATARIAKALQSRRAQKTYWGVTIGAPSPREGEISGFLRKSSGAGGAGGGDWELMRAARHGDPGAQHARTLYAVQAVAGARAAWVAMRPLTGRTHQLRVHMAGLGCALLGDGKYTCDREAPTGLGAGLHLHAWSMVVPGEAGRPAISVSAPLPAHMTTTFDMLGFDASAYEDRFDDL